jgi:hypothetical protein
MDRVDGMGGGVGCCVPSADDRRKGGQGSLQFAVCSCMWGSSASVQILSVVENRYQAHDAQPEMLIRPPGHQLAAPVERRCVDSGASSPFCPRPLVLVAPSAVGVH